jgi:CRP/FNR family transcriptional regulator
MKLAARDGSRARTTAGTSTAAPRPAAPPDGRHSQQRPATTTFQKGDEIFAPGSGAGLVYIVRSGCVRLFKTLPDGRSINLALLGPNTIFTQEDGFDGIASGATAAAVVDSTLSVLEGDDLAALIADSPALAGAVVAGMTRRLTELQMLVEHLLVRDTSVRLATTLLSLASRFGRPTADGTMAITLPLTHQGLANMIGSNRVTVTRKLQELQDEGMVRSIGRNALAVNPELLRAHAARRPAATMTEDRANAGGGE